MSNDSEDMSLSPVKPFILGEEEYCHKDLKKADSCCNFACKRQDDLAPAPAFVLTYYQIKYSKGKNHRVCKLCYDAAVKHNEVLYEKLRRKEPLFHASFPMIPDIVVIEDSDDECDDEEQTLDDSVLEFVQENISSVFESVLAQYDVSYQIEEAERNLKERVTKLQESSQEISQILTGLQESVDANRRQFYELFIQPRQEQPGIVIQEYDLGDTIDSNRSYITSKSAGVAMKKVTQINRPHALSQKIEDSNLGQEVVALEEIKVQHKPLPPIGPLLRPRPRAGETVYVMKSGYYGVWSRAKIIGLYSKEEEAGQVFHSYKIKFEYRKGSQVKTVPGKQLAYNTPSPVRLPVGTRVIALFHDEGSTKESFYAGVIAEPPKSMNDYRYLVFFDDGYAQYIVHEKILLVCESSRNVWEDIHPETRSFIHTYLERFPERPMVKLQSGQVVKTEWNGKWWVARVIKIDCSLVKMHFDADNRTEWIYRGSTRLSPLYIELSNANRREQGSFGRHRGLGIASLKKRNMPYVEYTRTDMDDNKSDDSGDYHTGVKDQAPVRAVAKKSTTKRPENFPNSNTVTVDKVPTFGRIESTQIKAPYVPRKFYPHQCSKSCTLNISFNINDFKEHNPLVIPMLCGWQRYIQKSRARRCIMYRGPCGRRIRNMEELHCYLRILGSSMGVDMFDFDFWVHCFDEFVMDRSFSNIKDVSYGMEKVPVSCVNNVDHTIPEFVQYSTRRIPMEGVPLNLNPEFLICCDCTDDCKDRSKCACWQLTIQGTAMGGGAEIDTGVGYVYKRLPEPVPTGIYECNSKCKCSSTCLNRVVQHPLRLKLQVFKTVNRGWGIRCINDVPQGAFICIYAGRLLTEQGANEGGKNYGDEYLAELDYIEVVERLKDGYESDVPEDNIENMMNDGSNQAGKSFDMKEEDSQDSKSMSSSEEETENSQDAKDSDEDFKPLVKSFSHDGKQSGENSIRTRLRKRVSRQSSTESNQEKQKEKPSVKDNLRQRRHKSRTSPPVSSPNSCITVSDDDDSDIVSRPTSRFLAAPVVEMETKPKYLSVRDFFGKEEFCYIMDAKNAGNIGRYLNHSCSPNVFVQNVFVDTHDLRFPWVAFFALTYIKAGTELTWDYNYDVGSVPGKVMYCHCGSQECRGRLL